MNIVEERIETIIEVLSAVSVLEYHDKNFLSNDKILSTMKKEFIQELKKYKDQGYIKIVDVQENN